MIDRMWLLRSDITLMQHSKHHYMMDFELVNQHG